MLQPRIIPCLLVKNKGLVKTIQFSKEKYIGDPINTVRIFNEKLVDELIILDISATNTNSSPDFKMIEYLAAESQMPLCYGGGIKNCAQAKTIINLGVEKIALSTAILDNPMLVSDIAKEIGSQSVVAVLDIKRHQLGRKYEVYAHNGKVKTGKCPIEFAKILQEHGVGEIVLNSIDNDGTMRGYDLSLVKKVRESIDIPMTIVGGAGSLEDIATLISRFGVIGAAAGSLFIYKGPYKAVLINYPNLHEKYKLFSKDGLYEG